MTEACTTSTLPAIGTPLPTTALPATGKVVGTVGGAARRANHVRRGVRRFRRAVTIVTCVTLGGAAAATGIKALPSFGGYDAAPSRAVLVGASPYGDYGALNRSAVGPSHLQAVTGYSNSGGGAVGFVLADLEAGSVRDAAAGGVGAPGARSAVSAPLPVPVDEPSSLLILAGALVLLAVGRRFA